MKKLLFLIPAIISTFAAKAQWIQTTNTSSRELVMANSRIIGGGSSSGGILISDDEGTTWTASNAGVSPGDLMNVGPKLVLGNKIFAVSVNKVYTSADNGNSWVLAAPSLPATSLISIFYYDGATIFVGYQDGKVFTSTDGGVSFSIKGNIGSYPVSFLSFNGKLYAGAKNNGMFTSIDGGATWTSENPGIASGDQK